MRATTLSMVVARNHVGRHITSVAQHGDAVDDFGHFIEPVRDINDADAGALQLVNDPEELARFPTP